MHVSETSSDYVTRAEMQPYFHSFIAAFSLLQGNIMSMMHQHSTQGNGMQPYQFAIPQALQQNLQGGRMQPSWTVTSVSLQPNQGNQVQSSHLVAPAFVRLAPPNPFASSFGFLIHVIIHKISWMLCRIVLQPLVLNSLHPCQFQLIALPFLIT